jgi:hypothetical protein
MLPQGQPALDGRLPAWASCHLVILKSRQLMLRRLLSTLGEMRRRFEQNSSNTRTQFIVIVLRFSICKLLRLLFFSAPKQSQL